MRSAAALLSLGLLLGACVKETPVFRDAAACLKPAADQSSVSLPALVDRADVIVVVTVTKAESLTPSIPPGQPRDLVFRTLDDDGQRVTLTVTDTVKGTAPPEIVVYDAPCQVLAAKAGESFVALLDGARFPDGTYRPVGLPVSALRATPGRSLPQLVTALRAIRPLDADAESLFERFGWVVAGKNTVDEFVLPPAAEFALAGREIRAMGARLIEPFQRYADLSAAVEPVDLRTHAGKPAELITFFLERKHDGWSPGVILGHALIVERRIAGAWVSISPEGPAFSLRERAAVLAAPPPSPGMRAVPANRAPQGINLARAYDLANARRISFKTGGGQGGEITDAARIRAFAAALDVGLATTQAVDDRAQPPTRYWFHVDFPDRYLSLGYDTADGSLMVWNDGFAAKAPAAFAAFAADLR